ncbi:hypothetical protein ABIB40_000492 [Pedobacter sp. UYP30]|uniref:hypothetical protein n=1 Tax=Pedobacter sp. UYP30 TaxID=1756400 RepID=UPI003391C961
MYNPFLTFDFSYNKCFLSGKDAKTLLTRVPLIPKWLLKQAELSGEEQIKLLDESVRSYSSLELPVDTALNSEFLIPLEEKMENAFSEGYSVVSKLAEEDLFIWIGKFLYGFIYAEMHAAIRAEGTAAGLNMSQSLIKRFGTHQFFIQKLYSDLVFENFKPWSITVVELADKNTPFSFRDEINTLTFSMKMKDFGIVACLQDNGTNNIFHQDILKEIEGKALSAEQFEELSARYYYSAYLFNRLPDYTIVPLKETTFIEPMPLRGAFNKPLFDVWQHKVYGQVLENFLKPWGFTLFEIIKNPEKPMSFFEKPCLPTAG